MSDSVRRHRRQPTRLPYPWDSPGKNTGVGCHFLLQCMKVKSGSEVAQSSLTLVTPWTAAHQAPPPMGFSRQKYWSGVLFLSPHATSIVFDKIPSCLDVNFGLVGSTGNQFIIIDVLACLYQSCCSLRMFRREIFVCVCMFSLQVLNFQGEKCSA